MSVLNLAHVEFQQFLRHRATNHVLMRQLTSAMVGIAISRQLPLPSQGSDDQGGIYDQSLVNTTCTLVSAFNENTPIDVDLACEVARAQWIVRYRVAHPHPHAMFIPSGTLSFFDKIGYVQDSFPLELIDLLNANSSLAVAILNRVTGLVSPAQKD